MEVPLYQFKITQFISWNILHACSACSIQQPALLNHEPYSNIAAWTYSRNSGNQSNIHTTSTNVWLEACQHTALMPGNPCLNFPVVVNGFPHRMFSGTCLESLESFMPQMWGIKHWIDCQLVRADEGCAIWMRVVFIHYGLPFHSGNSTWWTHTYKNLNVAHLEKDLAGMLHSPTVHYCGACWETLGSQVLIIWHAKGSP